MRRHYISTLFIAITLLSIGGIIYISFREKVIFTSWLNDILPFKLPNYNHLISYNNTFISGILYSLPDALWYGALLLVESLLHSNTILSKLLTIATIALPFILELLQMWFIIPGTFDWIDIILYILTLIIFLLCTKNFYFNY